MKRSDYQLAKSKEAEIAELKTKLNNIESGKILSLTIRTFSTDKQIYEDAIIDSNNDLCRTKLKGVLLDNLRSRYKKAQEDYELLFVNPTPAESLPNGI